MKKVINYLRRIKSFLIKHDNKTLSLGYDEYVKLQLEKTTDPSRVKKWQNEEWFTKLEGFEKMFERLKNIIESKKNALCLGSRTGQEVEALRKIGKSAIGVDLVAFPPYTIVGDVHNLPFEKEVFDMAFTNIYDHVLLPEKMLEEVYRVLNFGGVFILQIQLGFDPDKYSVNFVYNLSQLKSLLISKKFVIIHENTIANLHDSMNYEIILSK
jgi:SAM-dependent methyltransferase